MIKRNIARVTGLFLGMMLILTGLVFTAIPANAASNYEGYTAGADATSWISGNEWMAQTFTASSTHSVTAVMLALWRDASYSGNITVSIRATTEINGNYYPTGGDLCSGTISSEDISSTSSPGDWYRIEMTDPYVLQTWYHYAVVVRADASATGDLHWQRYYLGTYTWGGGTSSMNGGWTWQNYGCTFMYQIKGDPASLILLSYSGTINCVKLTGTNYASVHDAASGDVWDSGSGFIGQKSSLESTYYYSIYRGFVNIDTSAIPDNAVITRATLNLMGNWDNSAYDFDITVVNGQPDYPSSPPVSTDYNYINYSGNGGQMNTSDFKTGLVNRIYLNQDGISWINKAGTTKLGLFSSHDIANSSPVSIAPEYVAFDAAYITVTYFVPAPSYAVDTPVSGYGSVSMGPDIYNLPGTGITLTATPAGSYSTFDHWESADITITDPYANPLTFAMPAQDITVKACFNTEKFDLTTIANPAEGGSIAPSSGQYDYNSVISLTATPTPGWHIASWSGVASAYYNTAYVRILNDTTVTVSFAVNPYTVTYDGNGGTGTGPTEYNKSEGDRFLAANNSFEAPAGKQFAEWNTAADGTGTGYAPGEQIIMPAQDLTMYAIWEPRLFISEYLEGGFGTYNRALEIYNASGTTIDLATDGYTIQMYQNASWSPDRIINLTGTIAPGDVFVIAQTNAAPAILEKADQVDGSDWDSLDWYNGNDPILLCRGTTIIDSFGQIGVPIANGWQSGDIYTWFTDLRRSPDITRGDTNPFNTFDPALEWQQFSANDYSGLGSPDYSLTINAVNGTVTKNPDQMGYNPGTSVELTANPAEDYHFLNWSGDVSGTSNSVNLTMDGNKTVTANFAIDTLTVMFESNGGSTVENQTIDYNGLVIEPVAPTKEGSTFGGWYEDEGLTDSWDFAVDKVISDITLYASWINTAPVLTNPGDKSVEALATLNFNLVASDADSPAQTLTYTISAGLQSGMTLEASSGNFTWTPTADQSLASYTVTFRVTDDGSPVLYDEETITITVTEPATPPLVTGSPENVSITYGSDAIFIAAASGTPTPTVQWQVDTGNGFTDITDGGIYSGTNTTTLTLTTPPVSYSSYQYRAVFTNGVSPDAISNVATLTVSKATATVLLNNLTQTYIGSPLSPSATTEPAGLTVVWMNAPQTNAGTYTVTATIDNANYEGSASDTFIIQKASQIITFNTLNNKTYGDTPFTISATTTSGLPVSFSVISGPASIDGSVVTITGAGEVTVRASQTGDGNYNAALDVEQSFNVAKADAIISVNGWSGTFDGNAHGATGSATGLNGVDLNSLLHINPITFTDVPGGSVSWAFDGNNDYDSATGSVDIEIFQATPIINATWNDWTFDGTAHAATGFAYGVGGINDILDPTTTLTYTGTGGTSYGPSAVAPVDAGTYQVTASFAGNTNYTANETTLDVTVSRAPQTILVTSHAPENAVYNTSFSVAATASSGLDVVITVTGGASGSGSGTATISMTSGTYDATVRYNQAGNENFLPATEVTEIVDALKASQVITVTTSAPSDAVYSTTFDVSASGGDSGNPVIISTCGVVCTGGPGNNSLTVSMAIGSGTGHVYYNQAGNENYAEAVQIQEDVTAVKAAAEVSLSNLTQTYDGSPLSPSATTEPAGLTVVWTNAPQTNAGTYTVTATIDNANYEGSASDTFIIQKAAQTITFNTLNNKTYGDTPFTISATTTSGLPVSFSVISGPASIDGSMVAITGAGEVTIRASQTGDSNHNAALDVDQSFSVAKANASISVSGWSGTYDGIPHGAIGSATGVLGETLSGLNLGTSFTDVPGGMVNWEFIDVTGNYNNDSGSVSIVITKANAKIVVTAYDVTYDGNAHTASGSATGALGESLGGLELSGTTHTDAGNYSGDPWTFTDITGNYNDASGTVDDKIDLATLIVTAEDKTSQYSDSLLPLTYTITGFVNGETLETSNVQGVPELSVVLSDPVTEIPGAYSIQVTQGTLTSSNYSFTLVNGTYTVIREDTVMNVDSQNPVAVKVSSDGGQNSEFIWKIKITQVSDNMPGDLSLIKQNDFVLSFSAVGSGGGWTGEASSYDPATGIATFTIPADVLGVETYTGTITLNNTLFRAAILEDVLVVYDPSLGFTTGGGWFTWPAGTQNPELEGARVNFGYTMKYTINKKNVQVKGSLLLIAHLADGSIVRIKSNALDGLAIVQSTYPGIASFSGKCVYSRIDADGNLLVESGNQVFTVYVKDMDEPGDGTDLFWFTTRLTISGEVFSLDNDSDNKVDEAEFVSICGGNIVVPHTSSISEAKK